MTERDLARIEAELGITLPSSYRQLMLAYPIPACEGNSDTELWDDAVLLIKRNQELRAGAPGGVPPWPAHFFCLGGGDSACVYALDLRQPEAPVWWIDHLHVDADTSGRESDSFAAWADQYLAGLREDLQGEGVDLEGTPEARAKVEAENAGGCLPLIVIAAVVVLGLCVFIAVVFTRA